MKNIQKPLLNRRDFIKNSSLVAGSFFIVPRHVLGGKGFIAPSDKLNIAAIGGGGKGFTNIMNAWNEGTENIVAICDVDDRRTVTAWEKFPNAKHYRNYREMLDKQKDIDAVIISTPDHTHAVIAMAAMQAGKHIYVEKPLTHNIYEARILTEYAKKYQVITQMGNQGASGDGIRQMQEWFDSGIIGIVNKIHVYTDRPVWPQGIPTPTGKYAIPAELDWDLWIGPAPMRDFHPTSYAPFKWRGWWDFGTGALGDMGCHLLHAPFQVLGLGYPTEVQCSVGQVFLEDWNPFQQNDTCPPASKVHLTFDATAKNPAKIEIIWYDGGIRPEIPLEWGNEPMPSNGVIFEGSKGKLFCEVYGANPTLLPKKNMQEATLPQATLPRVERGVDGHQTQWVQACKTGFGKNALLSSPFDVAGPFTEIVLMGNLAIRSYFLDERWGNGRYNYNGRKKLVWDGPNMKVTNFDEANQFVKRQYREGWSLGI